MPVGTELSPALHRACSELKHVLRCVDVNYQASTRCQERTLLGKPSRSTVKTKQGEGCRHIEASRGYWDKTHSVRMALYSNSASAPKGLLNSLAGDEQRQERQETMNIRVQMIH